MKRLLTGVISAVLLMAGAANADPIYGIWQTEPDEGAFAHVKIAPCGAQICGTIIRTFKDGAEIKSPNIGKQLVREMTPAGNGHYQGKVWRPSNNKIYIGKIDLQGSSMKLRGCVAGGLICAKQTWSRIK